MIGVMSTDLPLPDPGPANSKGGPRFSVIMPVHNARPFLADAVASVLRQTIEDWELILVDDGSEDGSMASIADVRDSRLRTITQANQGAGPARNRAAGLARGAWLAFLDADDVWFDDHLAELDRVLRTHPRAALIGTAWTLFQNAPAQGARVKGEVREIDYFAAVGASGGVIRTSSIGLRRDAWQALGGFGPYRTGQDSELWVRAAIRYAVAISTRVTVLYRTSTGGLSDQKRSKRRPPATMEDLSPAVATLLNHYPPIDSPHRTGADQFVRRYIRWRLSEAVYDGDLACVRALERLYRTSRTLSDQLFLRLAHLPAPLAKVAHRAVLLIFALRGRITTAASARGANQRGI